MKTVGHALPVADKQVVSARMTTGTISVEIENALVAPQALFDFAQRKNPRRSFLFVSKVLGRHIPVRPSQMRETFDLLASQIPADLPRPVVVIGMAETAVGLGAAVHQAYAGADQDVVFLSTTRQQIESPVMCTFEEEHSHASTHYLYQPTDQRTRGLVENAKSLVLVDDEMSTGNTFVNLVRAIQPVMPALKRIVLATLTDWSDGAAVQRLGPLASSVALLHGRYTWTPNDGAAAMQLPERASASCSPHQMTLDNDWGRAGIINHTPHLRGATTAKPGENILVLGTGEYVWQPFLLAEELERQGANVRFSAVTQSPIALGLSISSAHSCVDNYGRGTPNYVYNVNTLSYDRIILCAETPAHTIDPALVAALEPLIITPGSSN